MVHLAEGGSQWGQSVDMSTGGIRFQAPGQELSVGDSIEVTFTLTNHSATVCGKVVRVTEIGLLAQEVALEFATTEPDLLGYLHEIELTEESVIELTEDCADSGSR